jgi:type I restriction enzyme S subunit
MIDAEYQRSKLRPGDVLLTIRGTVGRLALVPDELDGANITQDTARVGIVRGQPLFYRHYLETTIPRAHFAVNTLGVAVQGINLRDVRTTPVPIPSGNEQLMISERLESIVDSLRTNFTDVQKFRQLKHGLMHDLLSGKARFL